MLTAVLGGGDSYDSLPTRSIQSTDVSRSPLTDRLLDSRPTSKAFQRLMPLVVPIAPKAIVPTKMTRDTRYQ